MIRLWDVLLEDPPQVAVMAQPAAQSTRLHRITQESGGSYTTSTGSSTRSNHNNEQVEANTSQTVQLGRAHATFSSIQSRFSILDSYSYDGPAEQAVETAASETRRRSAQLRAKTEQDTEENGPRTSGFDRSVTGNKLSRGRGSLRESLKMPAVDSPRRSTSFISRAPTFPRRSLSNLKATPAPNLQDPALHTEHKTIHVPGSFQSEYDASVESSRSDSQASLHQARNVVVEPLGRAELVVVAEPPEAKEIKSSAVSKDTGGNSVMENLLVVLPLRQPSNPVSVVREISPSAIMETNQTGHPRKLLSAVDDLGDRSPENELSDAIQTTKQDAPTPDMSAQPAIPVVDFKSAMEESDLVPTAKDTSNSDRSPGISPRTKAMTALSDIRRGSTGQPDQISSKAGFGGLSSSDEFRQAAREHASVPSFIDFRKTFGNRADRGDTARKSMTHTKQSEPRQSSISSSIDSDLGSKQHWVRHFLGRNSTPAISQASPTLTARPQHRTTKIADDINLKQSKSFPVTQNFRHENDSGGSKSPNSFAGAITDLESLLQQAIQIVEQTDTNSIGGIDPERLSSTQKGNQDTKFDHVDRDSVVERSTSDEETSSDSPGQDEEQNRTSVPTQYANRNRNHVSMVEPEEVDRYHAHFKSHRHATPYPHASIDTKGYQTKPIGGDNERRFRLVPRDKTDQVNQTEADFGTSHRPLQVTIEGSPKDVQNVLYPPIQGHSSTIDWSHLGGQRQPSQATPRHTEASATAREPTRPVSPLISGKDFQSSVLRERRPSKVAAPPELAALNVDDKPHSFSSDEDKHGITYFSERPSSGLQTGGLSRRRKAGELKSATPVPESRSDDVLTPLPSDVGGRRSISDAGNANLKNRHHLSIREPKDFILSRSHRRAPIARDWSASRKRWVALIACFNTALMGLITGIYAGEVPAIQYAIVDEHHYTILGNVVLFIGLAITTFIFWPLPLLYGRKPFTLAALAILMPLQFPQAVAINGFRTPYTPTYRVALLLSRAISGLVMGFANINFIATLLDLFGASLQSVNPHQEIVNVNDVRRHGGGMGIWLGIWTWCFIGSIGVGFFIGAVIISGLDVSWGFWITIILTAFVLVLNVMVPEVRRSSYRRSVAEVRTSTELLRRVARGEVKMHLYSTGPKWWIEEVLAGQVLCFRMIKQPGFLVLSAYTGWIYGQIVMIIVVGYRF